MERYENTSRDDISDSIDARNIFDEFCDYVYGGRVKLPDKVYNSILEEAKKNARFSWYSGWEKSSGYISSQLYGQSGYGHVKLYVEWKKKKDPTIEQINEAITKKIDDFLENKEHHSRQRDFTHYVLTTFYVDIKRLQQEVMMSIENCLPDLIKAIEKYDDFELPRIQSLHNDLKNLECGINDHGAIQEFLEHGKKRIGES